MASREHIIPAIESALRKFGVKPVLHTDCSAHYISKPISVAEATQRLEALAKIVG
jgi:hypothetical protein